MSPRRGGIRYDDHEGFDRPGKGTRPRTKDRPDYSKAVEARVLTVDRGRFRLLVAPDIHVSATKARNLGRKAAIVGDVVRVVGDTTGEEGTLARIVGVLDRRTVLRRTADDDDPYERPIVANADQLVIVTALADPPPRTGMIDRILVAAYEAGLEPVLCLTKADLADPDELITAYRPLRVPTIVTQPGSDLTELTARLSGRISVLVGHSGVGKSTLVNALIPGIDRAIGIVNEVTGRGRHTSTAAIALPMAAVDGRPDTGWIIDTPGVRSFGLSHVTPDDIISAFGDLSAITGRCPRGCDHTGSATECALDAAADRGDLSRERLDSFRRVIDARTAHPHY